ncbi:SGNH/GDSL hydrolase family protein, partial [Pectobacterium actinidiae]|uniref:SGNH/GDSL hydrolase family protein n=1 Tax=Pectobacterium actinidiae TaxID=1507808 RepID=UPI002A7F99E1
VEIVVEPGVYFYTSGDNNRNIIRRPGARINRFTRIQIDGTSRFKHGIGSCAERVPAEKEFTEQVGAGEVHIPHALDFITDSATTFKLSGVWPNVVFTPASEGFTIGASSVSFTPTADGFWGAVFPVLSGDTVIASCRDGGKYNGIVIETVNGWVLVRYDSEKKSLAVARRNNGVFSETNHIWGDGVIQPYSFDKAITGVYVIGEMSVGIIVNGAIVLRINTASAILSAGWVNGYSQNKTCTISDPVMMRGKKSHGLPLINVVCIGDSTGDRNVTTYSQFDYAAKYYAGMGGGQVARLTNLAASGENSSQQLARLLNTDIRGYTFCLIQIGVNNIQQQKGVAAFLADIDAMIDYCRSHGVEPVVGIPAMFYTRDDITTAGVLTDHIGQPSNKADSGTLYRLGLMRLCATKNVMQSSSGDALGIVTPRLLEMSGADPIMMDNIHQTAFGSMLMGLAWARAMAAYFVKNGSETKRKDLLAGARSASAASLPSRYFSAGGGGITPQTPIYTASDDGKQITLSYYLSRGDADWTNDVIVGKLPARLRPVIDQRFLTQGTNDHIIPVGGLVSVVITRDGNVRLLGATNDCYFMPFNITYAI